MNVLVKLIKSRWSLQKKISTSSSYAVQVFFFRCVHVYCTYFCGDVLCLRLYDKLLIFLFVSQNGSIVFAFSVNIHLHLHTCVVVVVVVVVVF
jgi:hypothetical protein